MNCLRGVEVKGGGHVERAFDPLALGRHSARAGGRGQAMRRRISSRVDDGSVSGRRGSLFLLGTRRSLRATIVAPCAWRLASCSARGKLVGAAAGHCRPQRGQRAANSMATALAMSCSRSSGFLMRSRIRRGAISGGALTTGGPWSPELACSAEAGSVSVWSISDLPWCLWFSGQENEVPGTRSAGFFVYSTDQRAAHS